MRREEMTSKVTEELEHMPRGDKGSPQNKLRMLYNLDRRRALGADPVAPAAQALQEAIATVARDHPDFSPDIDHKFFGTGGVS